MGYTEVNILPPAEVVPNDPDHEDLESLAEGSQAGQVQPITLRPNEEIDMPLVSRIIRHLVDMNDRAVSRKKAYAQGTALVFIYVCNLLQIDHDSVEKGRRTAKRLLYEKIIDVVRE